MANVTTFQYGRHKNVQKEPLPILANEMAAGVTTGTAATVVFTAPADRGVAIDFIDYSYRTTPTGGSIQISDGTLTWGPFTIAAAGKNRDNFDPPLLFGKGANVTVTLADGSVTKDLFAQGHVDGTSLY